MKRAKVLLADDHTILAEGLAVLLKDHFDLVGIAADGRALVEMAKEFKPDVIVADVSMPLLNGIDALGVLRKEGVRSKVIILTMHEQASLAAEAFRAGAAGYLIKQSATSELVEAIREVIDGKTYISARIPGDVLTMLIKTRDGSANPSPLTARQREILQLTAEGKSMKEIADLLKISYRTVESHKYSLMQTLGLKSTAELVQYAIKTHLI